MKLLPCAAVMAAVLVACGDDGDSNPQNRANLSTIQNEIFTPKCATAGCHNGPVPTRLDLRSGQSRAQLVDVAATDPKVAGAKRVTPGNRSTSVLFQAITTGPTTSGRMPSGQQALSQSDIDAIGEWIDAGALDN
jgi:hypothetical protein